MSENGGEGAGGAERGRRERGRKEVRKGEKQEGWEKRKEVREGATEGRETGR